MTEKKILIEELEIWPLIRLVCMVWVPMLIIFFLPSTGWAFVIKIVLGLFILLVIISAFQPTWEHYETMGAFVTMQVLWLVGLLWVSASFFFLQYIFIFLIILGIATKLKHIKDINRKIKQKNG